MLELKFISKIIVRDINYIEVFTLVKPYLVPKTIFLLKGPMGVGKTEFVKQAACFLNTSQQLVSSPTFALFQEYIGNVININHWDLYRLKSQDDLESSGFWDQFYDESKLIFIEWPERLNLNELPTNWNIFCLDFSYTDKGFRLLDLFRN